MKPEEEAEPLLVKPGELLIELIATRLRLFSDAFVSIFSLASDSVHRAEQAKEHAQEAVHEVPARVAHGGGLVLRKLGVGLAGAVYVCLLLLMVLVIAVALAAGLLWFWVEEPVFLREPLHFDYTQFHPAAALTLGGSVGRRKLLFPAGHTFDVSIVLLMPESDFNRHIGVFQITAEVISVTGEILERSSQPCMLRFRSPPIRLARTFIMGVPLVLGITGETQEITVKLLKYKELGNPRTEAIRIRLQPRAGTSSLPELYSSEVRVKSQLPWRKELVRKWKWTFYVWTSVYIYIVLLIILVYWFRPLIFPAMSSVDLNRRNRSIEVVKEWQSRVGRGDGEISDEWSDSLRRWQRSRSKRKIVPQGGAASLGALGASASGVARDDVSEVVEDSGDYWAPSEPECVSAFHPR
ncbi:seipin-1 [Aristolochia californica]|uniref:seipin-1 n=1 Tax=Aristolochia californica TaxID=171875 RepID=UPI0035DD1652